MMLGMEKQWKSGRGKQILFISIFAMLMSLTAIAGIPKTFDLVVAEDGSGNFTRIADAIAAAPSHSSRRYYIKVMAGIYREYFQVEAVKTNIGLVGDGTYRTIITGNRSYVGGREKSATVEIHGAGFTAWGITFNNSAGPTMQQATALYNNANLSAFYGCRFDGYQDTLHAARNHQFYRECDIYGTVDFIYGNALVVFQNCRIFVHQNLPGKSNPITAQGRPSSSENSGIVLHNCSIMPAKDYIWNSGIKTYLGRPWRAFSMTVVMQSYLSSVIDPEGWLEWENDTFKSTTVYYREYNNRGPGAKTTGRVKWSGFGVITNRIEAEHFTVRTFIGGETWLPSTGIPYTLDLIPEILPGQII